MLSLWAYLGIRVLVPATRIKNKTFDVQTTAYKMIVYLTGEEIPDIVYQVQGLI